MGDPHRSKAERLAAAAFQAMLQLYPRAFRRTFGPEMSAVFADILAESRPRGSTVSLGAAARELAGLPGHALRQHLQPFTRHNLTPGDHR